MKVIEDTASKVIAGAIIAFLSTIFGVRAAQAKTATKLEEMEKASKERMENMEKTFNKQLISMGREIGELKQEVRTMRDDFYKPRVND